MDDQSLASAYKRLQEIDLEQLQMQERLKNLPALKAQKAAQEALKALRHKKLHALGQRKDLEQEEREIKGVLAKIEADEALQEETLQKHASDYRVVEDVEKAMTSLAKQKDKALFQLGRLQEKLDEARTWETMCIREERRLQEKGAKAQKEIALTTQDMKARVQSLLRERTQCFAHLSPDERSRYEEAQKRFSGLGVEVLNGIRPSICRIELQSSDRAHLKENDAAVQSCPYCGRILLCVRDTAQDQST